MTWTATTLGLLWFPHLPQVPPCLGTQILLQETHPKPLQLT